jgi:hypothetical protein
MELGTRSSKQQLKEELNEMYEEMTDPKAIDKRKRDEDRKKRIKDEVEDYGL